MFILLIIIYILLHYFILFIYQFFFPFHNNEKKIIFLNSFASYLKYYLHIIRYCDNTCVGLQIAMLLDIGKEVI